MPNDGGERGTVEPQAGAVGRMAAAASFLGSVFFADRRFWIFLAIAFANGVIMGPFLPFLALYARDELGVSQTFTANYRAITSVFMAVSVLLGAAASDSLGPKWSVALGVLQTVVAGLVFAVGDAAIVLGLGVFQGLCQGFMSIGGETFLMRAAPMRRIGAAAGTYFLGSTAGAATGAALGGALLEASSFRTLGMVMLLAGVPLAVAAVILLPPTDPVAPQRPPMRRLFAGYLRILQRGYVRPYIAIELLRNVFWAAASLAMPFIVGTLAGSKSTVGYFSATIMLGGVLAMLVIGPVSDRLGRRGIFVALLATMGLSAGLLAMGVDNLTVFFIGGTVAAAAAWSLAAQVPALTKGLVAPEEAGRLLGMGMFPSAFGILIGAQMHGLLTESHPAPLFLVLAALLAVAAALAILMFRMSPQAASQPRSLPESDRLGGPTRRRLGN